MKNLSCPQWECCRGHSRACWTDECAQRLGCWLPLWFINYRNIHTNRKLQWAIHNSRSNDQSNSKAKPTDKLTSSSWFINNKNMCTIENPTRVCNLPSAYFDEWSSAFHSIACVNSICFECELTWVPTLGYTRWTKFTSDSTVPCFTTSTCTKVQKLRAVGWSCAFVILYR